MEIKIHIDGQSIKKALVGIIELVILLIVFLIILRLLVFMMIVYTPELRVEGSTVYCRCIGELTFEKN